MQAYTRQKKQEEQPKETGQFVPRDARKQVAQELKSTHFTLGSDQSDFRSKNEVAQQDQNWKIDLEEKQLFNKFSHNIKQSHIQLGANNKTSFQTTHLEDYNKKSVDLARVQAAIETKTDLRKSHFQFGSQNQGPEGFLTTNQERFKKNNLPQDSVKNSAYGPDKLKSSGNKIFQGNEKPSFKTSQQDALVTHDLTEAYKNLHQQHEQGKNLRKHNFQLGYSGETNLQTDYQQQYYENPRAKSVQTMAPTYRNTVDSKRSNIEIGSKWQQNDYQSIAKMSLQPNYTQREDKQINFNPAEQAAQTKLDLRKSHFQVGTAPPLMESSAQSAFKNLEINNENATQKAAIQNKMQRGNFQIGIDKSAQFETTYKAAISTDKAIPEQNALDQRKHLFGSINFGSHQNEFVSETKSKYLFKFNFNRFVQQQAQKDQNLQLLIEKNRNPHFKFGNGQQHDLTTVNKQLFDYKGNPQLASLNEAQKADLRTHHFQMGSHNFEYQTSSLKTMNEPQVTSSQQKFESKSLLKNSGQRIFGGNSSPQIQQKGGEYKTTNQSYQKWIQPEATALPQAQGLEEATEADCDQIVNYFDSDQDGKLSFQDFFQIMLPCDALKLRAEMEQRFAYAAPAEKYRTEHLTQEVLQELTSLFEKEILYNRKAEDLKQKLESTKSFDYEKAFHSIDDWNYGYIDKRNMSRFLKRHGYFAAEEDVMTIIRRMDLDADARLSLQEFSDGIRPQEPYSKVILRRSEERKKIGKKSPTYKVVRNQSATKRNESLIKLTENQRDTIRTQALDRSIRKQSNNRSPLKSRPIINKEIITLSNRKSSQNTQRQQNPLQNLRLRGSFRDNNQDDSMINNDQQESQRKEYFNREIQKYSPRGNLQEFLDNQYEIKKKHNYKQDLINSSFIDRIENKHNLLNSIQDQSQTFNVQRNRPFEHASPIRYHKNGNSPLRTKSPVRDQQTPRDQNSPINAYQMSKQSSLRQKSPLKQSDLQQLKTRDLSTQYEPESYRSLRRSQHTITTQRSHRDLEIAHEQKQALTKAFLELINLEMDSEKIKIQLSMRDDFNLIEAFGIIDLNGKGYVTPLELRDALIQLGGFSKDRELEMVYIFYEKYNNARDGRLRYSDFTDAFMPFDEHYSRLLGLKRMHYLRNQYTFQEETMRIYMRAWELLIMNERAAENIRQRIGRIYRFDYGEAFFHCDINRDNYISLTEVISYVIMYS